MMAYPASLEINSFMSSAVDGRKATDNPFVYKLFGLVVHEGRGLQWGHYKSYVQNFSGNSWFCCNDESITRIPSESALSKQAYVLFYKKVYLGEGKKAAPKAPLVA